jgi:transposase
MKVSGSRRRLSGEHPSPGWGRRPSMAATPCSGRLSEQVPPRRLQELVALDDPGCVKTCYDSLAESAGGRMARFVEGMDREQLTLLPEFLEDWVDENNPVRAVDVFVEALDLIELGFDGAQPMATGRPGYKPSVLLKLYIYGYLNRVQSSRRLEREAGRNLEVMWLTGRLAPDHKTIADFRKDNGLAIKKVCAQFVELCRQMGLLAKASVAIDGSKFKAVNSRDNNFTKGKLERRLQQIEESVARYMGQLDTADRQTAAGEEPSEMVLLTKTRLKEKLVKLEDEVMRLKAIEKQVLASPDQQVSLTDPDCRSMATSGRGSGMVAYNVQRAVDTEHHLIVAHEVTNVGTDRSQLAHMGRPLKPPCTPISWTPLLIAATSTARKYWHARRLASR